MDGSHTTDYDVHRHLKELCLLNARNDQTMTANEIEDASDRIDEMMGRFIHTFFDKIEICLFDGG